VIVVAATQGVEMPGYVTLIAAITGLGGLQMVMLGVIGEYIGRIYYETKQRPHYLVKESNLTPPGVVLGGTSTSTYRLHNRTDEVRLDRD
jgi:glycosyltransferase involved in cell wall biosynthesis